MDLVVLTCECMCVCVSLFDQSSISNRPCATLEERHSLHITADTPIAVMVRIWAGFLSRLFSDEQHSTRCLVWSVGSQGLLPVDYRDLKLEYGAHEIFVGIHLHLSTDQAQGETIEDKFELVRKRLEAHIDQDGLAVVAFGTFVEVHWWKCRAQRRRYDFEASGGSLTRIFKADLAFDNEKMHFKHYLSLVKGCWDSSTDICPLELKRTE